MKKFGVHNAVLIWMLILGAFILPGCGSDAGNGHWDKPGTTIINPDAPTVTTVVPAANALAVPINTKIITAAFSKAMDPASLTVTSFTLECNGTPITGGGAVTYLVAGDVATLPLPAATDLPADALCTATITTAATAQDGNALASAYVWTFTTAAAVPLVPLAIDLGSAASFGIASRAGLTSTGVTVVNGDVALSPTAICTDATGGPGSSSQSCLVQPIYASLTGMTVTGSIFWAADPFDSGLTADTVTTDLTAAWNEGMAKVNTQPAIAADELGGKIFIPGVYENANLTLAAGGVATLDAQNDPNAIFIFKTTLGGDLIDSGTLLLPSRIDLINGAQARNVWFVVGRDATIGSGTTWNGNILANRTATVLDGSTVNGRVLGGAGGAGAITLTGAAAPSVTTINVP